MTFFLEVLGMVAPSPSCVCLVGHFLNTRSLPTCLAIPLGLQGTRHHLEAGAELNQNRCEL